MKEAGVSKRTNLEGSNYQRSRSAPLGEKMQEQIDKALAELQTSADELNTLRQVAEALKQYRTMLDCKGCD